MSQYSIAARYISIPLASEDSPVLGLAYLDWFPDEIPAKGYPEAAEEQPEPLAYYPEF